MPNLQLSKLDTIAKIAGIAGFALTSLSYAARSVTGESVYSYTLISFGLMAFIGWVFWVTLPKILNLVVTTQKSNPQSVSNVWKPDGFTLRRVFYIGDGQKLFHDAVFANGADAKKGGYENPVAKEALDDNALKIYRLPHGSLIFIVVLRIHNILYFGLLGNSSIFS